MLKYLKQNKNIFIVAIGLFIASMSTLLFFLNNDPKSHHDLKTSVVESTTEKTSLDEEKHYRELIGNQEDPVIVLGLDGTIHFASREFEESVEYTQKELMEKLFFNMLHPEDLGIFMEAFGKVIESEKSLIMVGPYRLHTAGGEYRVHMGSIHPLKEHEKIVKLGVTTRDISSEIQKNELTGTGEKPAKDDPQWMLGNRLVMNFPL